MSARYTQMPKLHYLPEASRIRAQSKKNKQGSGDELDPLIVTEFLNRMMHEQDAIYENYQWALDHGIAREIARLNTPVSRYSKMRASTDLWNWLHFLELRMDETAQYEIRMYANAIYDMLDESFPRTRVLFDESRELWIEFKKWREEKRRGTLSA